MQYLVHDLEQSAGGNKRSHNRYQCTTRICDQQNNLLNHRHPFAQLQPQVNQKIKGCDNQSRIGTGIDINVHSSKKHQCRTHKQFFLRLLSQHIHDQNHQYNIGRKQGIRIRIPQWAPEHLTETGTVIKISNILFPAKYRQENQYRKWNRQNRCSPFHDSF